MDREDAQRYAQDDAGQKTEKIVRDSTKTMKIGTRHQTLPEISACFTVHVGLAAAVAASTMNSNIFIGSFYGSFYFGSYFSSTISWMDAKRVCLNTIVQKFEIPPMSRLTRGIPIFVLHVLTSRIVTIL